VDASGITLSDMGSMGGGMGAPGGNRDKNTGGLDSKGQGKHKSDSKGNDSKTPDRKESDSSATESSENVSDSFPGGDFGGFPGGDFPGGTSTVDETSYLYLGVSAGAILFAVLFAALFKRRLNIR
jgi:hypothetical protein